MIVFLEQDNSDPGLPACLGAGWYMDQGTCKRCPAGFKCPAGRTQSTAIPCEAGTYQDMVNRASCRDCDIGYYQNQTAQTACVACPAGWSTSGPGTPRCDICIPDDYYYSNATRSCIFRGSKCNPATQYEDPASKNALRVCRALTPCNTKYRASAESVSYGALASAAKIIPREQYILQFPTLYSNWRCIAWDTQMKCMSGHYALQMPVEDDNGFLIKQMICKPYTNCLTGLEYTKVWPE